MKTLSGFFFSSIFLLCHSISLNAAVVLQYHHIGEGTPRITSATEQEFKQHLEWLKENGFKIISLVELTKRIRQKNLDELEKVVAITFDDQGSSVCNTAWPILKAYDYPFTVFVSGESIASGNAGLCTIAQLKAMLETGLLTIGNHGHQHLHMLDKSAFDNQQDWEQSIRKDILGAQKIIESHLGEAPRLFAYPYGEANIELEQLLEKLGYVSFGQQSGAIGNGSNLNLLPRFPLSGVYANSETLVSKLNSLAFPIQESVISNHPIKKASNDNPPSLELLLGEDFNASVQCYTGDGKKMLVKQQGARIFAKNDSPLSAGRARYNCTAQSKYPGRFYWFSYQWVIEN